MHNQAAKGADKKLEGCGLADIPETALGLLAISHPFTGHIVLRGNFQ